MKVQAFTLIEMLVVIAVIAVVSAVMTPVFAKARHSAMVTQTVQQAHQLSMALILYRTENDGDGKWGKATEMGLPPGYTNPPTPDPSLWRTACHYPARPPEDPFGERSFARHYNDDEDGGPAHWSRLSPLYEDRSPVVISISCTDPMWNIDNPYHPKLGIGADLTGTLLRRQRTGKPYTFPFWVD